MRTITTVVVVAGLLAFPWTGLAQEAGAAKGGQAGGGGGGTQVKETTKYDFAGDDVTGDLVKPSGSNIQGDKHGKTSSLIDIRSDFVPEMLKTVEDL